MIPACPHCLAVALWVHCHYQCANDACWARGIVVATCCDGEVARREDVDGLPQDTVKKPHDD